MLEVGLKGAEERLMLSEGMIQGDARLFNGLRGNEERV